MAYIQHEFCYISPNCKIFDSITAENLLQLCSNKKEAGIYYRCSVLKTHTHTYTQLKLSDTVQSIKTRPACTSAFVKKHKIHPKAATFQLCEKGSRYHFRDMQYNAQALFEKNKTKQMLWVWWISCGNISSDLLTIIIPLTNSSL